MSEVHNYAEDKADADELIAEFGQDGFLLVPNQGVGGTRVKPVAGAPTQHAVKLVVDPEGYTNREIDGTRIKVTDKKVYVAVGNLPVEVSTSHRLSIGGVGHEIVDAKPLNPGGTVVMWTIQARK